MVVGAKVCELTVGFVWFVCVNFDVFPQLPIGSIYCVLCNPVFPN